MRFFLISYFSIQLVIALCLQGCQKKQTQSIPSPGPSPISSLSPSPLEYRGSYLFNLGTPQDITQNKLNFLQGQFITQERGRPGFYNLGEMQIADLNITGRTPQTLRNPNNNFIPNAPVIHQYHNVGANVPLIAAFPLEFIENLPLQIQEQIRQTHIDVLDIFFVPQLAIPGQTLPNPAIAQPSDGQIQGLIDAAVFQDAFQDIVDHATARGNPIANPPEAYRHYVRDQIREANAAQLGSASLKPEFWMDPIMPNLNEIVSHLPHRGFTRWYQQAQMSIYEPNRVTIEDQVRINQLRSFTITPHDGLISNDVGHMRLNMNELNYSFWSLVISPTLNVAQTTLPAQIRRGSRETLVAQRDDFKAAVTLHWLMDQPTHDAFLALTRENINLETLLQGLDANAHFSTPQNAHLLQQLRALARP